MHHYFNKRFHQVHRPLLLKEKQSNYELITNDILFNIRDDAGTWAIELAFIDLCAVRSRRKMIQQPSQIPRIEDERDKNIAECDSREEEMCVQTIDVSGTGVPSKRN